MLSASKSAKQEPTELKSSTPEIKQRLVNIFDVDDVDDVAKPAFTGQIVIAAPEVAAPAEFSLLLAKKPRNSRINGMYMALSDNRAVSQDIALKFHERTIANPESDITDQQYSAAYILIELKIDPEIKAFALNILGFEITGQHLRIDKFYHERSQGVFSFAHLSIELLNPANRMPCKLRIYFNSLGRVLFYTITQINPTTLVQQNMDLKISDDAINVFAIVGKGMLQKLLLTKEQVYKAALTDKKVREEDLEQKLKQFIEINDERTWLDYQTSLNRFLDAVKKVNLYCESKMDRTNEVAMRMYNALVDRFKILRAKSTEKYAPLQQQDPSVLDLVPNKVATLETTAEDASTNPAANKEKLLHPDFEQLMRLFDQYEKFNTAYKRTIKTKKIGLDLDNLAETIALHELIEQIEWQIIFCLYPNSLDYAQKQKIHEIEQAIHSSHGLLQKIYIIAIKKLNLAAVKALYPYVHNQFDFLFYEKNLIANILQTGSVAGLEICKFLYSEQDYDYAIIVWRCATQGTFGNAGGLIYQEINLVTQLTEKNLPFFSMLLEHGLDPNVFAAIHGGKAIKLLPYLLACHTGPMINFAKQLINHGAQVEYNTEIKFYLAITNADENFNRPIPLDILEDKLSLKSRGITSMQLVTAASALPVPRKTSKAKYTADQKIHFDRIRKLSQIPSALLVYFMSQNSLDEINLEVFKKLLAASSLGVIANALNAFNIQFNRSTEYAPFTNVFGIHAVRTSKQGDLENTLYSMNKRYAQDSSPERGGKKYRIAFFYTASTDLGFSFIKILTDAFLARYQQIVDADSEGIKIITKQMEQANLHVKLAKECLIEQEFEIAMMHIYLAVGCYDGVVLFIAMCENCSGDTIDFLLSTYLKQIDVLLYLQESLFQCRALTQKNIGHIASSIFNPMSFAKNLVYNMSEGGYEVFPPSEREKKKDSFNLALGTRLTKYNKLQAASLQYLAAISKMKVGAGSFQHSQKAHIGEAKAIEATNQTSKKQDKKHAKKNRPK